jgi:hypothetical protein
MDTALQDNRSPMTKKFYSIAVDCVAKLRDASDNGELATPNLVGQVQDEIVKALAKVHFMGIETE